MPVTNAYVTDGYDELEAKAMKELKSYWGYAEPARREPDKAVQAQVAATTLLVCSLRRMSEGISHAPWVVTGEGQ